MTESAVVMSKEFTLLTFRLGASEFGVDIHEVQEIRGAETVTAVPNAPAFVEGVMELRGKVIPVLDLRRRFSIASDVTNYRILLVRAGTMLVGMIVDRIGGVLRLQESVMQDIPELAATQLNKEFMRGIVKVGDRVIFILNLGKVLMMDEASRLHEIAEEEREKQKQETLKEEDLIQYVTFPLGNEIYGVEIVHVVEIVGLEGLTRIPYVPDFVLGVINVRGTVLWVVDIRQFFNVPKPKDTLQSCVILLTAGDKTCGLLVDGAPVVRRIAPQDIQPPLSTLESGKLDFINGEVQQKQENQVSVYILLDTEKILTLSEKAEKGK